MLTANEKKLLSITFKVFDFDNNGKIERSDFERLAMKYAEGRGLELPLPQLNPYYKSYIRFWDEIEGYVDGEFAAENPEGIYDGRITEDEWNGFWLHKIKSGNAEELAKIWTGLIFDIIDSNSDGVVDLDEYTQFLKTHELDKLIEISKDWFSRIDRNNDQTISIEELTATMSTLFSKIKKTNN